MDFKYLVDILIKLRMILLKIKVKNLKQILIIIKQKINLIKKMIHFKKIIFKIFNFHIKSIIRIFHNLTSHKIKKQTFFNNLKI